MGSEHHRRRYYKDDKVVLHLTRKERDDKYDLNQLRTEPWIPIKMRGG